MGACSLPFNIFKKFQKEDQFLKKWFWFNTGLCNAIHIIQILSKNNILQPIKILIAISPTTIKTIIRCLSILGVNIFKFYLETDKKNNLEITKRKGTNSVTLLVTKVPLKKKPNFLY